MIEVRSDEDIKKLSVEYAKRVIVIEKEVAKLRKDIDVIRKEGKLDGVPVKFINKAMREIKIKLKQSEADRFEEETWFDILSEDKDIVDGIATIEAIKSGD